MKSSSTISGPKINLYQSQNSLTRTQEKSKPRDKLLHQELPQMGVDLNPKPKMPKVSHQPLKI